MFTLAFAIFLGFIFLFIKLPSRITLRALGRPLLLDLSITILATALHWGSFSGVIIGGLAGMMASIFSTCARFAVGYIDSIKTPNSIETAYGFYHPGRLYAFSVENIK